MHRLALLALVASFAFGLLTTAAVAQTQAGAIKAVKIVGTVERIDAAGQAYPLTEGQALIESDSVRTGADSGVVVVFMNGSSIKLGADSRLAIEEFKMDPLDSDIAVASLQTEPSTSKTRLNLAYGEMVGNVKKLATNRGSTFDVKTPVGAAGIRGTTFRIVLRFQPSGEVAFQLSTAEGRVVFSGTVPVAGGTTVGTGSTPEVEVAGGQEVAAVATFNAATNTVTSVQVTTVQPISTEATAAITTAVTQAIQQAVQSTTFTPSDQQQAAQQTPPTTPPTKTPTNDTKPANDPNVTPPNLLDTTVRSGSS